MSARTGIFNYLTGRALCKVPRPADEAEGLLAAHRAEVLHETPLFLAEFDSVPSEVHSTLDDARDWCDDIAKTVGNGSCWDWSRDEDGVYVQFWTADLDDRPLHLTGGTVTEIRVQRPADAEKATPTGEATPDFFQPDHTYRHGPWAFRCDAVTTHPETGERTALGWFRFRKSDWTAEHYGQDVWDEGAWSEGGDAR
jgi:hypothetical protein